VSQTSAKGRTRASDVRPLHSLTIVGSLFVIREIMTGTSSVQTRRRAEAWSTGKPSYRNVSMGWCSARFSR
jgi:hypothetical protein